MYGFIFKTTLPNGKSCISRHKCGDYDDHYFGSAKLLQDYFKSKGLNSQSCPPEEARKIGVKRETLVTAETKAELDRLEKKYSEDKPDPFFH
ncbi:hypothetical protein FACS189442_2550 [Spirochaetia bacterium]|nr:hypothetical protein FACS189442_2550 [Spirochaetia bacterium]